MLYMPISLFSISASMANNNFQFETGDILRFTPLPHYAVYIGDAEIVHYNKPEKRWTKGYIMRETLEDYIKRY